MSSPGSSNSSAFEFEDYVLRPSERLLLQNGSPVPLKAKVFETLLSLVENRDRALSKEDLMKLIWSDRFVEESNLSQYIFILRRILGENPRDHRFIVTIPGFGYRFVAKVNEVQTSSNGSFNVHPDETEKGKVKSVAILPLQFLDPAQQDEFLGLAFADTLITQLSGNKSISVRSTAAIVRYTNSGKDPMIVAQQIKVDAIMSGTIYKVRDVLAVNLQLTNVSTQEAMWANRFEINASEFPDLQTEIAAEVADALAIELEQGNAAPRTAPRHQAVYQKYLKARFLLEKRTEAGLLEGLACCKEIVEAEPEFALAHAGVADSFLLLGKYLYLAPDECFPFALEAANRALALDPSLAEGYSSLAEYYHYYEKNWGKADEHYQRGYRLNPNYPLACHWYAWALMCRGQFGQALSEIERAQMIDPSSILLSTTRGLPFYFSRDYRNALKQFELTLDIDPGHFSARFYLACTHLHNGDTERAIREFETIVSEQPIQQAISHLGFCYAEAGRFDDALEQLDLLAELSMERYVSPYIRAIVYCGLGRTETVLSLLEQAHRERDPWLALLRIDPFLSCVYGEPRFIRLVDGLGRD